MSNVKFLLFKADHPIASTEVYLGAYQTFCGSS